MCLDRILERFSKTEVAGIGYKVFKAGVFGELLPEYKGFGNRPSGTWLHERKFRGPASSALRLLTTEGYSHYPVGWHIFCNRTSAYRYAKDRGCVVRKVRYRDARTLGVQHRRKIIVAKEIFILRKR